MISICDDDYQLNVIKYIILQLDHKIKIIYNITIFLYLFFSNKKFLPSKLKLTLYHNQQKIKTNGHKS